MNTSRNLTQTALAVAVVVALTATTARAFFGPKGKSKEEKQAKVRQERDALLRDMVAKQPDLEAKIQKVAGYATFSTVNVNLLVLASNNGYGLVVENNTKQETFMRVASLGGGVGAGIRDLRVLFIFNDAAAIKRFVEQGWQFGGAADATATASDKGIAVGEDVRVNPDTTKAGASVGTTSGVAKMTPATLPVEIYQVTAAGVALQATVSGTKYWKDRELNQ
jgi:lipid-binding SYLF domain-containing protein